MNRTIINVTFYRRTIYLKYVFMVYSNYPASLPFDFVQSGVDLRVCIELDLYNAPFITSFCNLVSRNCYLSKFISIRN